MKIARHSFWCAAVVVAAVVGHAAERRLERQGDVPVVRLCNLSTNDTLRIDRPVAASQSIETNRVSVSFARGKWNAADFSVVKSARWDGYCLFDQLDDGIVNHCPDISGEEVFRTCHSSVYAALVHKSRFAVGEKISSTMMFDYRMAPIIVLAEDLVRNEKFGVDEFREHWEVCLYDCGVNVWHHFFKDGVQKWHKSASLLLPEHERFKPNVKYDMQVSVARNRNGLKEMKVEVGGYTLTHINELLPDTFRAGVIACEGRNFFYDFRAERLSSAKALRRAR